MSPALSPACSAGEPSTGAIIVILLSLTPNWAPIP